MKFIRDIIGEKRQMNEQSSDVVAANGTNSLFADDFAPEAEGAPDAELTFAPVEEENALNPEADPFLLDEAFEADAGEGALAQDSDDDFADILAGFSEQEEIDARDVERVVTSMRPAEDMSASLAVAADEAAPIVEPPMVQEAEPAAIPAIEPEAFVAPAPRPAEHRERDIAPRRVADELAANAEEPASVQAQPVEVPPIAMGRGASRQGRVKTRLLGFNAGQDSEADPIASNAEATAAAFTKFPLGWLIVTDGPGRGAAFTIFSGVSKIGRGKDQTVALDFGDNSISRDNHAAIAFDAAQKSFFIGHGGKANLVRRNDRPVLSTEELAAGDKITIGETVLRFVPLCGPDFVWEDTGEGDWSHAANS